MDATELINALFDHLRDEHGLTSDEQLSPYLGGVSDTQIWRWRDGQLGKIGPVLIPLIFKYHDVLAAQVAEA